MRHTNRRGLLARLMIAVGLMVSVVTAPLVVTQTAGAVDVINDACTINPDSAICKGRNDKLFGPDSFWTRIINTLIFIVGSVAVIMMVIGGLRFTLSGGDASGTKSARETIIYAVVGMVIAIMSYAIVNLVLSKI